MRRILRTADVLEETGLTKTSLRRRVAEGEFPQPISLGPRSIGWHRHEVEEWLESRERVLLRP